MASRLQLVGDEGKAERLAALKEKDAQKDATGAIAPKATTKRYHRVTVRDGGTLQAGKVVIRLAGIAARDADATCKDENGKIMACGGCRQSRADAADPRARRHLRASQGGRA